MNSAPAPNGHDSEPQYATLTLPDGRALKLPILLDHSGAQFLDIRSLTSHGLTTIDPGLTSTAFCSSEITYIDGEKGQLRYRGYDIEDLVAQSDFYDCSFLLLHGELPTGPQREAWKRNIADNMLVHESLVSFIKSFRHDAHPMGILCGVVGALSAFFPEFSNVHDPELRERACLKLISVMPTLAAFSYKSSIGEPIVYPTSDLSYVENFLHMMFSKPMEPFIVDPVLARALEVVILLHQDHEQNASTSTVRTAGSSLANPFACIASGVACLWGPAHGGANEAVIQMLECIGSVDKVPEAVAQFKDKTSGKRLMGFGHRLYRTYDPRATIMRKTCHIVMEHLGIAHDPLLELAIELERVALQDEYFKTRHLYPNTDFYSGLVLRAMGIPREMFTVIFALSRTVGWLSQWKEMAAEQPQKIVRPRQMFMGVLGPRAFVPLQQRTEGCSWEEAQEDRINNLRREAARTARVRASTLSLGVDSLKIGRVQNTQL